MTPAAALRVATLAPAVVLGATDSLGVIAPGMLADLVLLRANPLDDTRITTTIHAVVTDGRVFARPALDSLLAESDGRRERR
jgi:imidazolonepropionase-like amidohydrolase